MEKLTYDEWVQYRQMKENKKLDVRTQKIIAQLHSKYFNHPYWLPCSCSGKTWQQWIAQLNHLYDQGHREGA